MKALVPVHLPAGALAALFCLVAAGPSHAVDAAAAQSLAKRSGCFKCHAVDKPKDAVAWTEVSAKNKGKADAQARLIKHITTGPKVKLEDGSEEEHPIIKSKSEPEIKNLVDWILSL